MMKNILLLLSIVSILSACNGKNANQAANTNSSSKIQIGLDDAKENGKAVFVVVSDDSTDKTKREEALKIAADAKVIYKNSSIIELNTSDTTNISFVKLWRLQGAPLPIILSISPRGSVAGGFLLQQATAEKLADLIPSPKLDEIYENISNGKATFVLASKASNIDKSGITKNCNEAIKALNNSALIVEIDFDDRKEAAFLKQLNVNTISNESTTIVINAQGQTTNFFTGSVETTLLVQAAKKVARGCTSTCGTNGC